MHSCVDLKGQLRSGSSVIGLSIPMLVLSLSLAAQVHHAAALSKMNVGYMWDFISFRFDSEEQQRKLMDDGVLAPGDSVPFDVDYDPVQKRLFLAMPHLLPGSAVTLATIENLQERTNPRLLPYPNMTWHGGLSGCNGLTSVYRMKIDECGRLWVVDSGVHLQFLTMKLVCPPQLFVFNLTTDEVIAHHRFANYTPGPPPLMVTIATEEMSGACSDDVYAYIADATGPSLFVFHLQTHSVWQVFSKYFYPDVNTHFSVGGRRFTKMTGVVGLALSPCLGADCDRYLYFHSFSGYLEGRVLTSVLRNSTLHAGGRDGARPFITVIGQRHWPSVAQAMSKRGVLLFGHVGEYSINCWNFNTPYNPNFIEMVEYDYERIRIQMGMKVVSNSVGEEEVWSISNNIQGVFSFDFSPNNTYPVYVVYGKVNELINNTACDL